MRKTLLFIFLVISALIFVGCKGNNNPKVPENVVFEDEFVLYDGLTHSIYVSNIDDKYTVIYEGNDKIECGMHDVTANIYDGDHLVLTLVAHLNIIDFEALIPHMTLIDFSDSNYVYDGEDHGIYLLSLWDYSPLFVENIQKFSEMGIYAITADVYASTVKIFTIKGILTIQNPTYEHYDGPYC